MVSVKGLFQIEGFNPGWEKVPKVKNAGVARHRVWTGLGKSSELLGVVRISESVLS